MKTTSTEYEMGYKMARFDIEKAKAGRNWTEAGEAVRKTMDDFLEFRDVFNGIYAAVSDYVDYKEWKF